MLKGEGLKWYLDAQEEIYIDWQELTNALVYTFREAEGEGRAPKEGRAPVKQDQEEKTRVRPEVRRACERTHQQGNYGYCPGSGNTMVRSRSLIRYSFPNLDDQTGYIWGNNGGCPRL